MRRVVPAVAIVAVAGILFSSATPASACYCALSPERLAQPEHVATLVEDADVIVVGTVVEIIPGIGYLADQTGDVDATVEVERFLKGTGAGKITVDDPATGGACGFMDESSLNERYLLMLERSGNDYRTFLCSGNAMLTGGRIAPADVEDYVASVEAVTGPGEAPQPGETASSDEPPRELIWAAAIILPIAFLAGAAFVWQRR